MEKFLWFALLIAFIVAEAATKVIIPSEMQGLVGLANGIVEGVKK